MFDSCGRKKHLCRVHVNDLNCCSLEPTISIDADARSHIVSRLVGAMCRKHHSALQIPRTERVIDFIMIHHRMGASFLDVTLHIYECAFLSMDPTLLNA